MAPLSKKTIQHFTHCHPLTKVSTNTEFLCDGCRTLGFGTRYRCEPCDSNLHDYCANSPLEISSFMHQHVSATCVATLSKAFSIENHVKKEMICSNSMARPLLICEFDVIRLLIWKLSYKHSEKYRVDTKWCVGLDGYGICCSDLHIECVLVPCEEEMMMSVPRSLKTPVPPPLASSLSFDAYYTYGYGVIPPPLYFEYAYRVPYAHGYGSPSSYGEFYKINSYQTNNNGSQV
ncbi:hypothetical protein Gogos_002168 [Gossypium gossypioides]|uniref:DC1 domain-containing protein n=1 Tax=Gossypium gossypioides TaxID=34282 RepID=A0A7J9CQU7_GOSGO|nr:hypothetical protein [Gossypium gossypioides]